MLPSIIAHLDRRVVTGDTGLSTAYNAGTDTTTWTIPFSIATDDSEGTLQVALSDTGVVLSGTTRPTATTIAVSGQGDLSARPVVIGVLYRAEFHPTIPFVRDRDGSPVLTGELLVHHCQVWAAESEKITAEVWRKGRTPRLVQGSIPDTGLGTLFVPVHAKQKEAALVIGEEAADGFALTGLTWTGEFITRARRV